MTVKVEPGQVIDGNPIINNAFAEPERHWYFGSLVPELRNGRRPSGYLAPAPDGQLRISGELIELEIVNDLRIRVREWRNSDYVGATQVTKDLFRHWFDNSRQVTNTRPFFAQQEAIETISFLTEAQESLRVGIEIPSAGEIFERWAIKMATGSGKTMVMAMTIAWSGLNRAANKSDARFTDQFLVVCPNLTVRDRLTTVGGVDPKDPESAFYSFDLIPTKYSLLIGQIRVQVMNWHQLAPKEDPKNSIIKRGPESDNAFARRILTDLSSSGRIMVLNDEAHHAYRFPSEIRVTEVDQDEIREATIWIGGLEKIANAREVLRVLDFSATPMYPGLFKTKAWLPFEWVVSDFALVDAIESGLVKIPRTPTDDNTEEAVPKYRNLWNYIKDTLPKRTQTDANSHPMMDYLSEADGPLKQLAGAWEETYTTWVEEKRQVPPVMIVICHDTNVAKLIEKHIAELGEASPLLVNRKNQKPVTVRIDSDALAKAEADKSDSSSEEIRQLVSTVGKYGKTGADVRCLVSVAMLSEGWDARNVTHILGLRAFASQLLCEQVVGRGLRRSSYADLSQPEYVDIYGVPFQLLPMAKATGGKPSAPPDYTNVHTVPDRSDLEIKFPRLVQVVPDIRDTLDIDIHSIEPIRVAPRFDPTDTYVEFDLGTPRAGMGGAVQDREKAYENFRIQRLMYRVAAGLIQPYQRPWLFPQALEIVQRIIRPVEEGGKIQYEPDVDPREICNLRYLTVIRERMSAAIRPGEGEERFLPALDEYEPIGSTSSRNFAAPTDKCVAVTRSHLSHAVCDSNLERKIVALLEKNENVHSWVKNHRLYLEIPYMYMGISRHYRPDFVVRLKNGLILLLEGKGVPDEKDDAKATAARRWVEAVNTWKELGVWTHAICYDASDLNDLIASAFDSTNNVNA